MAYRYIVRLCQQSHGNLLIVEKTWKLFPLYSVICKFCKRTVRSCFCFSETYLSFRHLFLMFLGYLHSLWGFPISFRASCESIEMDKDLNWSTSLLVLWLSMKTVFYIPKYANITRQGFQRWYRTVLVPFGNLNQCSHCSRRQEQQVSVSVLPPGLELYKTWHHS